MVLLSGVLLAPAPIFAGPLHVRTATPAVNEDTQWTYEGKKGPTLQDPAAVVGASYKHQDSEGCQSLDFSVRIKPSQGPNVTCGDLKWQMAQTVMGNENGACSGKAGAKTLGDEKAYIKIEKDVCRYAYGCDEKGCGLDGKFAFYDWVEGKDYTECVTEDILGAIGGVKTENFVHGSIYRKNEDESVYSSEQKCAKYDPPTKDDINFCTGPPLC